MHMMAYEALSFWVKLRTSAILVSEYALHDPSHSMLYFPRVLYSWDKILLLRFLIFVKETHVRRGYEACRSM